MAPGESVEVRGTDRHLGLHLTTWARRQGHRVVGLTVTKGGASGARWQASERAGVPGPTVWEKAPRRWGLAARGALVEAGGPDLSVADLDSKAAVWSDLAPRLYAQAAAAQWDPATAIDWSISPALPDEVEAAVVQVMTYLIENEQAALMVPARFLGRIHPHYREVAQLLAVQTADEARHIEVFTRRALLVSGQLGVSGAGGRASLQSLLDETDFSIASFLLSVLGEGTFLHLLSFLERYAPDVVTAQVCHLALQDEARHVAFGLGHLEEQLRVEPALRPRLRMAMERRHDALASTSGLNDEVFDALVVLAARGWTPDAIGVGHDAVQRLQVDMDEGRRRRLTRLGFSPQEAAELSALHTRNFM
ncbi:MAG: hypothetical protein QOF30_427 [Acidimicrobiaceae bacterium]|jgi:hypothetical protein|nr:hypothetical protein [Acidimicrobiaceae bacterium]